LGSDIATLGRRIGSARDDDARINDLLGSVGERVRSARARMGLSRRVLAERSGVSQRYLAQLESGQGNISIGLLLRVADALNFRIDWLVAEEDPFTSDAVMISSLLRSATRAQRARVLEILDPENPRLRRGSRIAFIGLRGAGKSTLGRLTAARLGLPFKEVDEDIAEASGMPAGEVMALYGQEGYRHLERQSLERIVAAHDRLIVAVAGGIVSQPETYNYLLRNFHTVWLRAEPEEHMARVRGQGDERPMAGNPDAMAELRNILTAREALYARADAHINTSKMTLENSVNAILDAIGQQHFLAAQASPGRQGGGGSGSIPCEDPPPTQPLRIPAGPVD
jgi:XRE family transcriptional regulator, aerobic/anaerobic benzoate catabolism transcriptional regulator